MSETTEKKTTYCRSLADEFFKSLDEKYGPSGSASDEDKADFQKEFQAGVQDCM